MGPRAGLDGRKISSPPGFDPGPSGPGSNPGGDEILSVAIPTKLPGLFVCIRMIKAGRMRWAEHVVRVR